VAKYPFLSDNWMREARKVRDEFSSELPDTPAMRMNLVITEVPFGDGGIDAHLDSSSGRISLDLGHLDKPDVSITTDFSTAKALFVGQDPAAVMQAFMAGKIRVQGDLAKLLALQTVAVPAGTEDVAAKVAQRIKDITEELNG
jgi:putative sterol carrier protein